MFYSLTVAATALLVTLLNYLFGGTYTLVALGQTLLTVLLGVAVVFIIDGASAFLIRRLPERWFAPQSRLFAVGTREKNLYRRIKVNEWKRYVPEWGCFTGFHKDKLRSSRDSGYIGRFLLESNYGVAGHVAGAAFGFFVMLVPPLRPFSEALPIAMVNMFLSLFPAVVLRFNTPALRRLYVRAVEKEKQGPKKKTGKAD